MDKMLSFKRKLSRKDHKAGDYDESEESIRGLSPPKALPPPSSKSGSATSPASWARRASEPFTSIVQTPTQHNRLFSEPRALAQTSTFGVSERPRSRSAGRHSDPLGLTVIYEPDIPPSCDIIFVHGLGGTSRATWAKGRDMENFWPQRWLPLEPGIGNSRILSFGYNANLAATRSAPITGIADFAKDLLYSMRYAKDDKLDDLGFGQRPIIFIVHSMGGLVAKQAYILGKDDALYAEIVSSVRAIIFLATPHRGSNLADVLNRILMASIFNHSPKLYVSELKNGSRMIEALNEQFRHFAPRLDVLSFYETLPTAIGPKKMIVVEKSSATMGYPNEISKSLDADHHTVCKFDSNQDPDYISVRNALRTLINKFCPTNDHQLDASEQAHVEDLGSLLGVSETYEDDLIFFSKRWTKGTCDWVLSHPSFEQWVRDEGKGPNILWLHALPGSGKSILSSFIVQHLVKKSFCFYYFFRFADQLKRSLSTCLRTIAYQIASQFPEFRRAIKNVKFSTGAIEKADAKMIWDKLFVGVLFKLRVSATMYWIIDGLDESENSQLLVELMQDIADSSSSIKILLISRQNDDLISAFDRLSVVVPSIYLPVEDTKMDIKTCIEKEVRYMKAPDSFKSVVVEKLVSGANGNFLWASFALVEVMRCNTQEDLDHTLEGIPIGMEQLYQRMESNIIRKTKDRPQDLKLGHLILTWAACSRRPLVLKELEEALQPGFSVMLDLKFIISRVCGQFLVVDSNDRLVMVHQTARDHIMKTNTILAVNPAEGHEKLFTKCILMLEEKFQRGGFDPRAENNGLVLYAVTSWAYHFNLTSVKNEKPLLCLANFLNGNCVFSWIASLAHHNQLKVLVYTSKIMTLYVSRKRSQYRLTNPLLHRLQELEFIELWAIDFLKVLGKFGKSLMASPSSIYEQIPPFCPTSSMIYRRFKHHAPSPPPLEIEGITKITWDDNLAKLSVGLNNQTIAVVCSSNLFAVLTAAGNIYLYNSTTFDLKQILSHAERICVMTFSTCSTFLATYGFRTTKIWSVKTGNVIHNIRNPPGSRAFTIKFAADNSELIIGSNDRLIRIAKLTVANPVWCTLHAGLLKEDVALDRPVHTVPWRIELNSDANCIAVAYRGAPLCVWSLDPPKLIRRCMRNQEYAGNAWTVVDQMIWHPMSEEVIGLYMGGHVFRWSPWHDTQQELQAYGSILASSPDGNHFVVGDSNGMIKLYNFHHFALIYQLSYENMINDICFSPDSKRLYDLRGQFCNIWEPGALMRAYESVEHENDIGSEVASNPTAAVSEATAEARDQLTAIGVQFQGPFQAIGNEVGVVSLIDLSKTNHSPIQLYKSEVPLSIVHLEWSSDGNYLASADLTGKVVVKRVEFEDSQEPVTTTIFEVKLQGNSEGIRQVLLDHEGSFLLVKNGPTVTVWPLTQGRATGLEEDGHSTLSSDTKWIKHPKKRPLLLAVSSSQVHIHRWSDLSKVSILQLHAAIVAPMPQSSKASDRISEPAMAAEVGSILSNASGSHLLVDIIQTTNAGQEHIISILPTSELESSSEKSAIGLVHTPLPPQIQKQIEISLGLLPKQRIIFLDHDYWICSWRVGANPVMEKVQKYYSMPRDWLNIECLKLCALLADGRFVIPNNGELAVIKSIEMSRW